MPYQFTEQALAMQDDVKQFMDDHIYPNEEEYYAEVEPRSASPATRRSWTS